MLRRFDFLQQNSSKLLMPQLYFGMITRVLPSSIPTHTSVRLSRVLYRRLQADEIKGLQCIAVHQTRAAIAQHPFFAFMDPLPWNDLPPL